MSSKKILVIEDNEKNLYLFTYILQNNQYEVYTALSGTEGIKKAKEVQPDIILVDIQLPEVDGFKVILTLREDENLKDITIIAVTSYAMPGDRETILSSGADGYIQKPIDPLNFVSEIEAIYQQKNSE